MSLARPARASVAACLMLALLVLEPTLASSSVATEPGFPAERVLEVLRARWVFRTRIAWGAADSVLNAALADATTDEQRARAMVSLFERAGDVHSQFAWQGRSYAHWEGMDEPLRQRLLALLQVERETAGRPASRMLAGRIAYVRVPSMAASTSEEVRVLAESLFSHVRSLAAQQPRGWIVDLRLNGGGNLYPMLVGLASLLGDGVVGGTADADGAIVQRWVLRAGALFWRDATGEREFASLGRPLRESEARKPVAVLLGLLTRSSGQALALAFRGRPRTVLVGEPTARGYTTVTAPVEAGTGLALTLAVGFMTDRRDSVCDSVVLPEVPVEGPDQWEDPAQDPKVQAALGWLERARDGGR